MIGLIFQKKLILIKQMRKSSLIFAIIGVLKILVLNMNHIFAMAVIIFFFFFIYKEWVKRPIIKETEKQY